MIDWQSIVVFPEEYRWVLVFQSKQPNLVTYMPYIIAYRCDNLWITPDSYLIRDVTHWAYINPPPDAEPDSQTKG